MHADALGTGQPTDLVDAVAGQIVKRAGVDIGVEIPGRGGIAAGLVRVSGDQTDDIAELAV